MKIQKRFIAGLLLLLMATTVLAESAPLTATDRVKNMANEEGTWRYLSGGGKLIVGGLITALGYSIYSFRENLGAIFMIPFGATIMVPGVLTLGWGASDLLFGSREYENQYDKLKLASDTDRENQATLYLKDKSEKDKQNRQPSFWNAFGLFSMFETPAEREYKAYLKDRNQFGTPQK
ncbi:MAG: hypothetical protein PHG97_07195 [Candidatus Margulisbacteria bacterium]|nr:hypothetical protein [Candidatus Margulisiibacteriota bacterium]